jgi:protein-disulfide isomerase
MAEPIHTAGDKKNNETLRAAWRWRITGVVGLLILAAGAVALWPRPGTVTVSAARLAQDPSLGPADAPVTIIEYGDFGCTTCRAWEQAGVLKQVLAKYGDQVHFVWRDYPIITAQSPQAALAGQCAFDQGKFWQYHDLLYARAPALSIADLKSYAAEIGMNTNQFASCLDSAQYQAKIDQSMQEARQLGFRGTPAFLVNNQPFAGPPSFQQLQSMIDPILAANK